MAKQLTPEVYYLQAISPEADRRLIIRCYGKQHDVIVDILLEQRFVIERISEEKFNLTEKAVNSNSVLFTTVHNIPSITSAETIETILKNMKKSE